MATKSARRKMVLATLKTLNCQKMTELIRLRVIRAAKRSILGDETACRNIIEGLDKRLQYEMVKNSDLLPVRSSDNSSEDA